MDSVIYYGSNKCGYCKEQSKKLRELFKKTGKPTNFQYYDVSKKKPPANILSKNGSYSLPTWVFIKKGSVKVGSITKFLKFKKTKKVRKNKSLFGINKGAPEVGTLKKYGKNFSNGLPINNSDNWETQVKKNWGSDHLRAGTFERAFGPNDDSTKKFTKGYTNNIRMTRPGDDLDTMLYNNVNCNLMNGNNSNKNTFKLGLNSDSTKPINRFGVAPAFKRVKVLNDSYGGGTQGNPKKPKTSKLTYINKGTDFGRKKAKEGSTLIIVPKKNGKSKIKVKN